MGAGVGLKPQDIYDMDLWEFNTYLKGYDENVHYLEEIMITKQAYYTGMFSGFKKPKPLQYYLDEIDKSFGKITNKPVDKVESLNIYEKIEKIKRKKKNE